MRLNPVLWSIGTQIPSQLMCRTKHVKCGDIFFDSCCFAMEILDSSEDAYSTDLYLPFDCLNKGMKEAIHSSHLACRYTACHANSVLNSYLSVKTKNKTQTIVITEKKRALKRSRN